MPKKQPRKNTPSEGQARYMKYMGLAMQLFVSFAIVLFIGKKIDAYLNNEKLYITMVLLLITFVGIMYRIMKDLQ
jgi:heme/copper-type cytochrome/quinol oxidase subunit 4